MKENITVEVFGNLITVEAVVVDDVYAVFRYKKFVCLAQKMGYWILEVVLDESYAPQVIKAFVNVLDYEDKDKAGLFPTA